MSSPAEAERPQRDDDVRIGVSACLLGEKVRFDGGHKRDAFLVGMLGRFVAFQPVCPEIGIGLGSPRESMRLVEGADGVRLVAPRSGLDHTDAMRAWAARELESIARLGLSGFVLKKDSPSCGLERVKTYSAAGMPARNGRGVFAAALAARFPLLPIEEEGRLSDPRLRENFVERVFGHRRVCELFGDVGALALDAPDPRERAPALDELVRFHTAEKFLLLAHDPEGYRALGRIVAGAKALAPRELARAYATRYMRSLARHATPGKHANVLEHMLGFFKELLAPGDKQEMLALIGDLRGGLVPLIVPVTLMRHHVRVHRVAYLEGQRYLEPHPKELLLRNHV